MRRGLKRRVAGLYASGTLLNPLHLLGRRYSEDEWTVRALTGPVLDLGFLGHRQRFWLVDVKTGSVSGCNVLRGGDYRFGYFTVRRGGTAATVDYSVDGNRATRRLSCELRATSYANLVVGRLYAVVLGARRFVGYFTLRRRGDRRRDR